MLSGALLFAAWFNSPASAALVDLDLLITPLGGSFRYDATVTNNGLIDLTLVTLVNAPMADPLIASSLTAPAGFIALYDSGLGFIDFLEGSKVFAAGSTVGGFSFNSATLAGTKFTTFEALDVNGMTFTGAITTRFGPTGSVPEQGSPLLLAGFTLALLFGLQSSFRQSRSASLVL